MSDGPVYLDYHATTPVDPRVLERMLPFFTEHFGNVGSIHSLGEDSLEAVDAARNSLAAAIGANAKEIVFTSGATESNNLALRGLAERTQKRGSRIVSVTTEHKAVLDPLAKLSRKGIAVTLLPVKQTGDEEAGLLDPQQIADALTDDVFLVSVMLANNEIGALHPIAEIGALCRKQGIFFHCDATQAVGKIPVDVNSLNVDLLSFSAHKIYGPKGIGALYVRQTPSLRLEAQIDGGGQERGRRSGTLNTPGIIGFAAALEYCVNDMVQETKRLRGLRDRLYKELITGLDGVSLNGPNLARTDLRLANNLNISVAYVDGEALMMNMKRIAVSSGAACTSTHPEPSHVLRALGLDADAARSSLRFGLGRYTTDADIDVAAAAVMETVQKLRKLSSMA